MLFFFFFNDTATTEIYTLSLHDALPIRAMSKSSSSMATAQRYRRATCGPLSTRSEEHTSELQSLRHLVCRLLLEKKKNENYRILSDRRVETSIIVLTRAFSVRCSNVTLI